MGCGFREERRGGGGGGETMEHQAGLQEPEADRAWEKEPDPSQP